MADRRRYGLVLGLIDRLPRSSKTRAAMEEDEEYVEMVREAIIAAPDKKDGDEATGPSLAEWSALHDIIADLIDSVRVLETAVIAAAGAKPSQPKMYTRPETSMTRMAASVRISKRRAKHEALVKKLLPDS